MMSLDNKNQVKGLPLVVQNAADDAAMKTAAELLKTMESMKLSFIVKDNDFNNISGVFQKPEDLLKNPEFITHLSQDIYICDTTETRWFMMRLKKGHFSSITFLLMMKIYWVKIINKAASGFDFIVVAYSPGEKEAGVMIAVVPKAGFSPAKIAKYFSGVIGENANDLAEIGKVICHVLAKHITHPSRDSLMYISNKQGFYRFLSCETGRYTLQFNPPLPRLTGFYDYLSPALQSRQNPSRESSLTEDITPILAPMFSGKKWLQIALLIRIASWFLFLFAKQDVYADNVVIIKPTPAIPIPLLVAVMKNTRYDSLEAPPVGPDLKPLRFELETVNDGMGVIVDPFAADQVKKTEKGYDLLIQDAWGASGSSSGVHHIIALISGFADLYIPREKCCVLEPCDTETAYSPSVFKTALKRMDANIICRIEHGCNYGDLEKVFKGHVDEVQTHISNTIPVSKRNIYIMLVTALRMYREFYSQLFTPDYEQEIEKWLISQDQDLQPAVDRICMEFGRILNQRIADGYYTLVCKQDVTPYDKGSHKLIVDNVNQCFFIETSLTDEIACDMDTISNPDALKAALYDSGYLPHNAKGEKSVRIAAINSDSEPYPLHVQKLNFTLLTPENRQRLDLIDKDQFLFRYNELPVDGFLPLIKTIDGRFAGKKLNFEAEASHHYLGTGRSGSGKSWQLGQLMPMLKMLGCNAAAFDTSRSYSEAQLRRMLPADVVDILFRFVHIGTDQDKVPVDLGSLSGCISLPDRKRLINTILSAAVGKFDRDKFKDNQQRAALKTFLSGYLKDKHDYVDLVALTEDLRSSSILSPRISEVLCSVFQELADIGYETQGWSDLFQGENRIIVIDLGNEVGDTSHSLLDILAASLFAWQQMHNERYLAIFIDELADQNFAEHSPLNTILRQSRKDHVILLGATQDYFGSGNCSLDILKQATIKSFARPGKAEDRIAEKLGFANAIAAGFPNFKPGDIILDFDAYSKDIGENEPVTMRGRVVDFVETPLYERFRREYQIAVPPANADESEASQPEEADDLVEEALSEGQELISLPLLSSTADVMDVESSMMEEQMSQSPETADDVPTEEAQHEESLPEVEELHSTPLISSAQNEQQPESAAVFEQLSQPPEPLNSELEMGGAVSEEESAETVKPEAAKLPTPESIEGKTAEAFPETEAQPASPESEPAEPKEDPQALIEQDLQQQFRNLLKLYELDYPYWMIRLENLFNQIEEKHHCATPSDRDRVSKRLECFLYISPECSDYRERLEGLFKEIWPNA